MRKNNIFATKYDGMPDTNYMMLFVEGLRNS